MLPDAVSAQHVAAVVDENVNRQLLVFDVTSDLFRALRHYNDEADAECRIVPRALCQFTEPAAAGRSPDSPMEREQDGASREVVDEGARLAAQCRQREERSGVSLRHHRAGGVSHFGASSAMAGRHHGSVHPPLARQTC